MATGKRKSKKKKNEGPDLLTIVVVLVALILVVVLLVNYNKDKEEKGQTTPTPKATEAPQTPTAGADSETQVTPQPTAVPVATPEATKAPETEVSPTPTEVPVLSVDEAMAILQSRIDLAADAYSIELLDDHLMIEGEAYYNFCINDTNGTAMEPLLIVEKKEGTLLCYDYSGVVSQFSKFPLDKTETGSTGTATITAEEAKQVLSGYSGAALGLAKEPSVYDMTVDEWTTVIKGKECYGINLFENSDGKQRFRGVYYVTLDGSAVYSVDEVTGDFIER